MCGGVLDCHNFSGSDLPCVSGFIVGAPVKNNHQMSCSFAVETLGSRRPEIKVKCTPCQVLLMGREVVVGAENALSPPTSGPVDALSVGESESDLLCPPVSAC